MDMICHKTYRNKKSDSSGTTSNRLLPIYHIKILDLTLFALNYELA